MDIGGGRDCCLWLRTAGMLSWIEPEPEPAKENAPVLVYYAVGCFTRQIIEMDVLACNLCQ